MHIFAGYYDLKIFVGEEGIKLIKSPKVYSLDEFLSLDDIRTPEISAEAMVSAIKERFDADNEYHVEIFQSEEDARDRLMREHELREWTEDNFMFAYLEVIDGKAFEIWLRPLLDE